MAKYVMCPDCDGSGRVDEDVGDPTERNAPGAVDCETCGGRGEILEES